MKNKISKKVNGLARKVMNPIMFGKFCKGDLDCRILFLSMIAAQADDLKIVDACEQWITMI